MKTGIISDSHGCSKALARAFELFKDADLIVHAGDILYHPPRLGGYEGYDVMGCVNLINGLKVPFVCVRGNCDSEVYTELMPGYMERETTVAGTGPYKMVINHGARLNRAALISLAKDCGAGVRTYPYTRPGQGGRGHPYQPRLHRHTPVSFRGARSHGGADRR